MFKDLKSYPGGDSGTPPAHWRGVPGLGVVRLVNEKNTGLREETVLSLSRGRVVVKPSEKLHGLVPASFESYQRLRPGNIVIRPTDLQNDQTSVRVGFVRDRGIITSAYLGFDVRTGALPEFAYLYLATLDAQKVFYGMGSGLRQNLDWSDFKRLPIALPPAEEQAAIVKYLGHAHRRVDQAIAAKRRMIALLEEQKQAIINQAVTRGLDLTRATRASQSRWFPRVPEGWDVATVGRVIRYAIDGPHFSPRYIDDGVPFLSARNVKSDRWQLSDVKYISEEDYREFSRRVRPQRGDVLYTKGGTTGVARVVDLDFRFQVWVHIAVLKCRTNLVDPHYLSLVLNSSRCYEQAQLETRGATNQDLGLSRMKRIEIPLPATVEEQVAVVARVAESVAPLDLARGRTRREIDLLREFRIRLTADVVTGQLDVREIAARLPELWPDDVAPDAGDVDDDLEDEDAEFGEDVET